MAGILCLNGFLGMGITMTNESLEQRIAKQEERLKQQEGRLKQLKAQKQAKDAREKAKQKEQDRKTIPDVKFAWFFGVKKMQDDSEKAKIIADLNDYLTEDRDRLLFDLQPISKGS